MFRCDSLKLLVIANYNTFPISAINYKHFWTTSLKHKFFVEWSRYQNNSPNRMAGGSLIY